MNLLFAIDDTFVEQLKTTLYSIWLHTSASRLDAFVLQEKELAQTEKLNQFCHGLGIVYHPVIIGTGSILNKPLSVIVIQSRSITGYWPKIICRKI